MTDDDTVCSCHGKTEAEIAAPYAMFVFGLAAFSVLVMILAVVAS